LSRSSASDVAISFCDSRACSSWSLTGNSFDEGELDGKAWWYDAGSCGCGVLDEGVLVDEICNHKLAFSSNSTLYEVKRTSELARLTHWGPSLQYCVLYKLLCVDHHNTASWCPSGFHNFGNYC
jgi:hypothetical protein